MFRGLIARAHVGNGDFAAHVFLEVTRHFAKADPSVIMGVGSIVDAPSTLVTDGTLLKVYAWYDNEMGYVCRMVDLANRVIAEA